MLIAQVLDAFAAQVGRLGWVSDLLVGGSVASGDYQDFVSDVDLVAVAAHPLDRSQLRTLVQLHRDVDAGVGRGRKLGCTYVPGGSLADSALRHPTWTHGRLIRRRLSGMARAELVRSGYPLLGRGPGELLDPMTGDDVRAAAREQLSGYWAGTRWRPWIFADTATADLALVAMARARHTIDTGEMVTKAEVIPRLDAPGWLVDQFRRRRSGDPTPSPRLRTAVVAWRSVRRTCRELGRDPARAGPG